MYEIYYSSGKKMKILNIIYNIGTICYKYCMYSIIIQQMRQLHVKNWMRL